MCSCGERTRDTRERPGAASHCLPVSFPSQEGSMPDAVKAGACSQVCLQCFRSISTHSTYQESNSFHELLCLDTVLLFYRCTHTHMYTYVDTHVDTQTHIDPHIDAQDTQTYLDTHRRHMYTCVDTHGRHIHRHTCRHIEDTQTQDTHVDVQIHTQDNVDMCLLSSVSSVLKKLVTGPAR